MHHVLLPKVIMAYLELFLFQFPDDPVFYTDRLSFTFNY
jgi:hypothetical protein